MMSGIFHNTNQGDYYTDEETETEESRSNVTATSSGLDKDTKRHVRALDPNESHCIVENVVETQAVEFVHVLPRKLSRKSKLIESLEWWWNTRRGTLNLDTTSNICRLGRSLRNLYREGEFILVPEDYIIERYYRVMQDTDGLSSIEKREQFPYIPRSTKDNPYNYKFLPIKSSMDGMIFMRRKNGARKPSDVTLHAYPFDQFPLLPSHIQPRFAIVEAGRQLLKLSSKNRARIIQDHPISEKLIALYRAWTKPIPEDALEDDTYRRYKPGERWQMDNDSSDLGNEDDTMRRLSEAQGKLKWTGKAIQNWSKTTHLDEGEAAKGVGDEAGESRGNSGMEVD